MDAFISMILSVHLKNIVVQPQKEQILLNLVLESFVHLMEEQLGNKRYSSKVFFVNSFI